MSHKHLFFLRLPRLLLGSLLFIVLLQACGEKAYFSENAVLPDEGWTHDHQVSFTIPVSDTAGRYGLYLDIDHSTEYLFQNVYVNIFTTLPDGTETSQLLPIDFADKAGNWYGDCTSSRCDLRVTLQERTYFNQLGSYRITLEQATRNNPLRGINALELKLITDSSP